LPVSGIISLRKRAASSSTVDFDCTGSVDIGGFDRSFDCNPDCNRG
jgi:hypothetical protein